MTRDGHGKVHGKFTLSALHGAMLEKALFAIAAPKHRAAIDGHAGKRRPTAERMGRAFGEYIESYPTNRAPPGRRPRRHHRGHHHPRRP